jgi:hypothetical protein
LDSEFRGRELTLRARNRRALQWAIDATFDVVRSIHV